MFTLSTGGCTGARKEPKIGYDRRSVIGHLIRVSRWCVVPAGRVAPRDIPINFKMGTRATALGRHHTLQP